MFTKNNVVYSAIRLKPPEERKHGGDVLQIRRVVVNVLNKQSRTADKGWSSSLGGWARG
jgi:hypothetical protein